MILDFPFHVLFLVFLATKNNYLPDFDTNNMSPANLECWIEMRQYKSISDSSRSSDGFWQCHGMQKTI